MMTSIKNNSKSNQIGAAISEYLPIIGLISSIAIAAFNQFGATAAFQQSKITQELAGTNTSGQVAPTVNYSGGGMGYGSHSSSGSSGTGGTGSGGAGSGGTGSGGTGSGGTGSGGTGSGGAGSGGTGTGGTGSGGAGSGGTGTGGTGTGGTGTGGTGTGGTGSGGAGSGGAGSGGTGTGTADSSAFEIVKEFAAGLWDGLVEQGEGLWELVTNPIESAENMIALGKALFDDPQGTMDIIAQEIGRDISALVDGTARQKGEVIGKYVSPVAIGKIVATLSRLGKIPGGRTAGTICSSFAAGTMVWSSTGLIAIEDLEVGDWVLSRNDESYDDSQQKVIKVFGRTAPHYYHVSTGYDEIDVTEEHPFWLQGKGWTNAKDLKAGNAVATLEGDLLIRSVERVNQPLKVYNFTVDNTHSYFVSKNALWVHNANDVCDLSGNIRYVPNSPVDYDHILRADYTKKGVPTGGHSLLFGDVRIVPGTETLPDVNGVYKATIQVPDPNNSGEWLTKPDFGNGHTLFPKGWDETRIKMEVDAAWNNPAKVVTGNTWSSTTTSGVPVSGYISPRTTVFPVFTP